MNGYAVWFDDVPMVGKTISYFGHHAELIDVQPYEKRGGGMSNILTWRFENGRIGTTGLKSKSMTWMNK